MSIISIAIQKGGCAKTTTAINLAAALQQRGKSVLLIDADPQASLTEALAITGDTPRNLFTEISREIKGENGELQEAIIETKCGLSLVPSSIELSWAELELVSVYGREQVFKWMLDKVKDYYDYILIDCPPSVSMLTVNALVASEYVLMPLAAEYLPYKGVTSFMQHFKSIRKLNKRLEVLGFVLTRYDDRKIMNRDISLSLEIDFPGKIFHTQIRSSIQLARAQQEGVDIFSYDPKSHGAADYSSLAAEFIERIQLQIHPVGVQELVTEY
jgi:chromosome partitioning protein